MIDGNGLRVVACGPERAEEVHRLTQAAFAAHRVLDPPSGAGSESLARVVDDLTAGGGAIAQLGDRAVGCLRWEPTDEGDLLARRVAVAPDLQRQGIGEALMAWAEDGARRRGCAGVWVGVRLALPGNQEFFGRRGYLVIGEHRHEGYENPTWLALRKELRHPAATADG